MFVLLLEINSLLIEFYMLLMSLGINLRKESPDVKYEELSGPDESLQCFAIVCGGACDGGFANRVWKCVGVW